MIHKTKDILHDIHKTNVYAACSCSRPSVEHAHGVGLKRTLKIKPRRLFHSLSFSQVAKAEVISYGYAKAMRLFSHRHASQLHT